MSTNKHASIRYQALDKCFAHFGKKYYIEDLVEACCEAIYDYTGKDEGIKKRTVQSDIIFMESDAGFSIPLERIKDGKRVYYRYEDRNFSINKKPISDQEREQLQNTLVMLNRFKGLPQFEWMEEALARFESSFRLKTKRENIVSFEQNLYLNGLNHFTELFYAIIHHEVLEIEYTCKFVKTQCCQVHPYHLKQYNNRWYLFGLCPEIEEKIPVMNLALDRIQKITPTKLAYIENHYIDFDEYFDDVIGVSVTPEKPQTIRLRVCSTLLPYIESKPIHGSQIIKERNEHWATLELLLQVNYELESTLLSFGDRIQILEPIELKNKHILTAEKILANYQHLCK